jgi:hypothetical protein
MSERTVLPVRMSEGCSKNLKSTEPATYSFRAAEVSFANRSKGNCLRSSLGCVPHPRNPGRTSPGELNCRIDCATLFPRLQTPQPRLIRKIDAYVPNAWGNFFFAQRLFAGPTGDLEMSGGAGRAGMAARSRGVNGRREDPGARFIAQVLAYLQRLGVS